MKIPFYDEYFSITSFTPENLDESFKDTYIRNQVIDGNIYKFVAFTDDNVLNNVKLTMLKDHKFWASYHIYFEDKNEVSRKYNINVVSRETNVPVSIIQNFFKTVDEMNNISCFTYAITDDMWAEYANQSNGFCMEFQLLSTNFFFPVVYVNKEKVDMTNDIIQSFKSVSNPLSSNANKKMSILPWVLKDEKYHYENELRFLCGDEYDDENGIMGGRIAAGKKKLMGIKGVSYTFEYAGIILKRIHIGANCTKTYELKHICDSQNIDVVQW